MLNLTLDLDLENQPGRVPRKCRFTDTDGVRFVLVDEVLAACYDRDVRNTERTVWVHLHRAGPSWRGFAQMGRSAAVARRCRGQGSAQGFHGRFRWGRV